MNKQVLVGIAVGLAAAIVAGIAVGLLLSMGSDGTPATTTAPATQAGTLLLLR